MLRVSAKPVLREVDVVTGGTECIVKWARRGQGPRRYVGKRSGGVSREGTGAGIAVAEEFED